MGQRLRPPRGDWPVSDPSKAKGAGEEACRWRCSVWLKALERAPRLSGQLPHLQDLRKEWGRRPEEAPYRRGLVRKEGDRQVTAGQNTIRLGQEGISTCLPPCLLLLILPG